MLEGRLVLDRLLLVNIFGGVSVASLIAVRNEGILLFWMIEGVGEDEC